MKSVKVNKTSKAVNQGIMLPSFGGDPVPCFRLPLPEDLVFYIYGPIEEELDYVEMIHAIRYADPGQEIYLHIASPGGSLSACLAIVNAIRASRAEVFTVLDGEACSAAAMIWLAGKNKVLGSIHTYLMVHGPSWGAIAKASDHAREVEIMNKVAGGLIQDLAGGLLTAQEMDDINKGVDLYLSGKEIAERTSALVKLADAPDDEVEDK